MSALAPAAPRLSGFSVLVVDDDADSRELLGTALEQAGATSPTACSAEEAIELLQVSPVHALVSDIAMPDKDGMNLIRKVRRLGGPPAAIPAIALTSLTRGQRPRDAIAAGFHRHLKTHRSGRVRPDGRRARRTSPGVLTRRVRQPLMKGRSC